MIQQPCLRFACPHCLVSLGWTVGVHLRTASLAFLSSRRLTSHIATACVCVCVWGTVTRYTRCLRCCLRCARRRVQLSRSRDI